MITIAQRNSVADNIAIVVVLLMAIGTVFVFSAGVNISTDLNFLRFYNYPALRQILFFPLACIIMYSLSRFNYQRLRLSGNWLKSPVIYLLALSIVLLAMVLYQRFHPVFPKFIPQINSHYRWIKIPIGPTSISFQPSELAKWSLLIFLAAFCDRYSRTLGLFGKRFVPICAIIGLTAALIIIEDFGTAAFICMLSFLILIIAGAKLWHVLIPVPFTLLAFFAAIMTSPARKDRILAFLHPEKWTDSINYQPNQSLIAIGSGGLWGKGLGWGVCKYGHLPEDTTDFIFAIIGEELGFVGTASVILLFIIFTWLGILVVIRCNDRFGQILAAAIILTIAAQAAINIAVVTVVVPTKGIPLPFISAGGTSMLLSAAAVGLLLNIAKQSAEAPPEAQS